MSELMGTVIEGDGPEADMACNCLLRHLQDDMMIEMMEPGMSVDNIMPEAVGTDLSCGCILRHLQIINTRNLQSDMDTMIYESISSDDGTYCYDECGYEISCPI